MNKFQTFTGIVAPLDRSNVDTDAIIPKQYLKSIKRTGFGENLFDDWRYLDPGEPGADHSRRRPNPDFILNQPRFENAEILLVRENFGCGSSREHAVWALNDFGIRTVIGESFADIFYSNAFKNGLLLIQLDGNILDHLFNESVQTEGYRLQVDLEAQEITPTEGKSIHFDIDATLKERLLKGLDDIGMTLEFADRIRAYEKTQAGKTPWIFPDMAGN
ncbi:MAG: 3-isopropylmalate dehydratase small subunit [Gammaproteobacteria bacterium]|nr:3-isopropylmalate dehydratase small subunit [Gammaproteobacteria bacterium]